MSGTQIEGAAAPAGRADIAALPVITLGTPEFREHSVRILAAACRAGPVCRVLPHDVLGFVRFRDVDAILRNPRTFSSDLRRMVTPEGMGPMRTMIGDDPPAHTRLRSLFGQAFTPARVAAAMEPRILAIARDLVGRVLDAGRELDLMRDVAIPLPVTVISEILGVDASDLPAFRRWSDEITGGVLTLSMPEGPEKDRRMAVLLQSLRELDDYLARAIEHRRSRPENDLLTFMIAASEGGDRLSEREVLGLAKLLLVAGNETTTKLIGLAMNLFLQSPPALDDLARYPGLIPGALEEVLRLEGPVPDRLRRTTTACELAGVELAADMTIDAMLGAANLDESVFPNPTRLDIRRKIPRHLAFGTGIHQCLGAPLARLEARIVFEELVSRMCRIEPSGPARRASISSFRGFDSMPLRYSLPERASVPARVAAPDLAVAGRLAGLPDAALGLDKRAREIVRVARVRDLTPNIKMFRLVHPAGGLLTRFSAGSHIVVHMRDGDRVHRNAYSLLNAQYGNGLSYFIAVALDPDGRGGSRYMHEKVRAGMELLISVPANQFPAAPHATKHLLVAGGIGVTPLFALRDEVRTRGQPCELHYAFRSASQAAFADDLERDGDPRVQLYDAAEGARLDVEALIRSQPEGTHVYVCGPVGLMDAVIEACAAHGWPGERVHYERFGAPKPTHERPFEVECRRSGRRLVVRGDETLLEALEREGVAVPFACRAGSCGACELEVLEGEIDHRDTVLSDAEKAAGTKLLACVSRAKTRLVLDR